MILSGWSGGSTKPHSREPLFGPDGVHDCAGKPGTSLRYNHFITNWGALDQVRGEGKGARSLDLAAPAAYRPGFIWAVTN